MAMSGGFEMHYEYCEPRIIAEQYMEDVYKRQSLPLRPIARKCPTGGALRKGAASGASNLAG